MMDKNEISEIIKLINANADLRFSWEKLTFTLRSYKYGDQELLHNYEVLIFANKIIKKRRNQLSIFSKKIVYLACMLHDIGRYKFERVLNKHTEIKRNHLTGLLKRDLLNRELSESVLKSIQRHSVNSQERPQNIEEKIVFDSDNLTLFTKLGYARWFFNAQEWGGDTSLI